MNGGLPSQNPTADEVISALARPGFILEYRVAQSLRKVKFSADINYPYPDPETGKSREIDVVATFDDEVQKGSATILMVARLVIECKNNPNPLVLIGERGHDKIIFDDRIRLTFDPFSLGFSKEESQEALLSRFDIGRLSQDVPSDCFVGHQLLRMSRQNSVWRADNNSIYDSILYPLNKAWEYELAQYPVGASLDDEDPVLWMEIPILIYVLPIIVTAGPVITVDVTEDDPLVNRVSWARLKREFHSKESSHREFRVDVVSFSDLADYIDSRLLATFNKAKEVISSNINFFDAEWLNAELGEPTQNRAIFNAWLERVRK